MSNEQSPLTLDELKAKCETCEPGECWEWGGAYRDPKKQLWPVVSWRAEGKKVYFYVRHLMVWIKRGKRPKLGRRFSILPTKCGNDQCVNPDHLEVVSRKTVMKKVVEAGHMAAPERCRKIAETKRKASGLSDDDVAAIRAGDMSNEAAAVRYGVTEAYVRMLRKHEYRKEYRANPFAGLM